MIDLDRVRKKLPVSYLPTSCLLMAQAGAVKVGPWGGAGGNRVDVGSASKIQTIHIRSGGVVDAVRIDYVVDGTPFAFTIGGTGGKESTIKLKDGEHLTCMSGYVNVYEGVTCVAQLSFTTNMGNAYGPYGRGGGTPFSLPVAHGSIVNFFGRGRQWVDALGVYLVPNE